MGGRVSGPVVAGSRCHSRAAPAPCVDGLSARWQRGWTRGPQEGKWGRVGGAEARSRWLGAAGPAGRAEGMAVAIVARRAPLRTLDAAGAVQGPSRPPPPEWRREYGRLGLAGPAPFGPARGSVRGTKRPVAGAGGALAAPACGASSSPLPEPTRAETRHGREDKWGACTGETRCTAGKHWMDRCRGRADVAPRSDLSCSLGRGRGCGAGLASDWQRVRLAGPLASAPDAYQAHAGHRHPTRPSTRQTASPTPITGPGRPIRAHAHAGLRRRAFRFPRLSDSVRPPPGPAALPVTYPDRPCGQAPPGRCMLRQIPGCQPVSMQPPCQAAAG